ncbi:MAG: ABC transporter ATP-binding protein, partial [Alphaproteobacteria bacterium]
MASIELSNLRKSFGPVAVIHGIDLEIEDSAFVVLVGPSGCGKSTLLRMIAGLEEISAGEVRIDGRVINKVAPRDRDIAMVFQNYALYPHMTVFENMAFNLRIGKVDRGEIVERVTATANLLGLTPLLDRYPKQLSGGESQRAAMGRAIVRNPRVYLFDEPLSNLDAMLRVQMRTEIKALHQRFRTTSVFVTHDQVEAMTMAEKMVVMREGEIAQIGDPLEVYDNPDDMFVAGFIGSPSMNFLTGDVRRADGAAGVVVEGGAVLPLPPDTQVADGRSVVYGVRPEHFQLAPEE